MSECLLISPLYIATMLAASCPLFHYPLSIPNTPSSGHCVFLNTLPRLVLVQAKTNLRLLYKFEFYQSSMM